MLNPINIGILYWSRWDAILGPSKEEEKVHIKPRHPS